MQLARVLLASTLCVFGCSTRRDSRDHEPRGAATSERYAVGESPSPPMRVLSADGGGPMGPLDGSTGLDPDLSLPGKILIGGIPVKWYCRYPGSQKENCFDSGSCESGCPE